MKADLLILDELSYLRFNRHQLELLLKVIVYRGEKDTYAQDNQFAYLIITK